MKTILFFILSLIPLALFAQAKSGTTRAVVIGISDYQDEKIPDLRYADKDAEAFANYLRSPSGGGLDNDHLKILLNEEATAGKVVAELFWLVEESQQNDLVIIYFSGHGDVEKELLGQPGHLLCWDAPPRVYMAGGTLGLNGLQTIISTLSLEIKAKVIIITDACRSGKLAGSDIDGSQLTNFNLAQQYANEIKILSCQPEEYSIEGEQWGGGRGAFSYHLLDGLYGMADGNEDLSIDLFEIGRYLEDHVKTEVAPLSQIPMTVGSKSEKLTTVNPDLLSQLRTGKRDQLQLFSATDSKGIEEIVLASIATGADTSIQEMYFAFKKAVVDKQFLQPEKNCADFYYNKLIRETSLAKLHNSMRRNYAAALQDDAQQAINAYLQSDSTELARRYQKDRNYFKYPAYLARAAELLGVSHYMYQTLLSRQLYFEGLSFRMNADLKGESDAVQKIKDSLYLLAETKLKAAFEYSADSPFLYDEMGVIQSRLGHYEKALTHYEQAVSASPKWVQPYIKLADLYYDKMYDYEQAKQYLGKAIEVDSLYTVAYIKLAWVLRYYGGVDKAITVLEQGLEKDLLDDKLLLHLANFYAFDAGLLEKAKKILLKGYQLYPNKADFPYNLARTLWFENYPQESIEWYKVALAIDSTHSKSRIFLSKVYMQQEQWDAAILVLKKGEQIKDYAPIQWHLGKAYSLKGEYDLSEKHYQKAWEYDPEAGQVYYWHAEDLMQRNEWERALEITQRGAARIPYLNANLAYIYQDLQLIDSSILVMERAVQAIPLLAYFRYTLGEFYRYDGAYENSIMSFRKALELDPSYFDAVQDLTEVYVSIGMADSAMAIIDAYQSHVPGNYWAIYQKGFVYLQQGKLEKAEQYYRSALQSALSRDSSLINIHIAEILWASNRKKEAMEIYREIEQTDFNLAKQHLLTSIAHFRLGKKERMETILQERIEKNKMDFSFLYEELLFAYARAEMEEKALYWLKQLLESGFKDQLKLKTNFELRQLRAVPGFGKMMRKYFSE